MRSEKQWSMHKSAYLITNYSRNMEGDICHHVRKLRPIPTSTPDVQSLWQWGSQLKGQWRRTFKRKYSNLLSLVSVGVQSIALSVLTQCYDLLLRCFTLRDFLLVSMLEEYERLLGMPFEKSPPYLFQGHYSSWASMAKLLKERLRQLQGEGDWLTFTNVYRLLVYGIVLFPHIEDYVDLAAIDAFLGKRDQGESPVIVVLANTYYTLNYCYKKNGRGLRCCTSLFYLWMTAHLFHSKGRMACSIKDHN
ncbi:hypothetical protein CR513_19574, partial [Mucuna pruriens]